MTWHTGESLDKIDQFAAELTNPAKERLPGYRSILRDRKFADSLLEESGFELAVPSDGQYQNRNDTCPL